MKKVTTQIHRPDANLNPDKLSTDSPPATALSRRALLGGVALLPSVTGIVGATKIQAKDKGASGGQQRNAEAFRIRLHAAQAQRQLPIPAHPANGDEDLYPNRIGNYSKGFPHNQLGEVDSRAYDTFLNALSTGEQAEFETSPMSCPDPERRRKLVNPQRHKLLVACLMLAAVVSTHSMAAQQGTPRVENFWGRQYQLLRKPLLPQTHPFRGNSATGALRHWNEIAINASGLDHTRPQPGDTHLFGHQLGPGRSSRAMAIVHIAIFEAVNAIDGKYESYVGLAPADEHASMECALAQAAHDTLCEMFPSQVPAFDQLLDEEMNDIPAGIAETEGIQIGKDAATAILALRSNDGSQRPEPLVGIEWITSNDPGRWRQDPISLLPIALGAHWGEVTPFVLTSSHQFRTPPPPPLSSAAYAAAYNEVKALGGDGIITPTTRTDEQTTIGIYWAYDGTPSLCAPPRLL